MQEKQKMSTFVIGAFVACLLAGCAAQTQYDDDALEHDEIAALENASALAPEQASGTSSFSSLGYKAADAGEYHTLAVRNDGKVFAAGSNYFGQLGNGSTSSTYGGAPNQIAGLSDITSVAAGAYHSLALTSTGQVWAWGGGGSGQLGNGTKTARQLSPVQISTLPPIKSIAAGSLHSLAIDVYNRVWAWGSNSSGQVGNGSYTNVLSPIRIPNLSATVVDGGENFSLALRTDGVVVAWGNNGYGQLARGNTISSTTPVVTQLTGITAISAGANHGIAVQGANLLAWGDNTFGELGIGTTSPSMSTTPVVSIGNPWWGLNPVAAGRWMTLVGSYDGFGPQPPGAYVYPWGYNAYGQLGQGTTTSTSQVSWPRVQYGNGNGVFLEESWVAPAALSAGGYHSVAIDWNGQVVAWGRNDFGQLGNGSTTNGVWASTTLFP